MNEKKTDGKNSMRERCRGKENEKAQKSIK